MVSFSREEVFFLFLILILSFTNIWISAGISPLSFFSNCLYFTKNIFCIFAFFYFPLNQWSLPAVVRRNTDYYLKRTSCHKNHSSQHSTNENKGGSKRGLVKWQKLWFKSEQKEKNIVESYKNAKLKMWRLIFHLDFRD